MIDIGHLIATESPQISYSGRLTSREFFIHQKDCSEKQSFWYSIKGFNGFKSFMGEISQY